MSSDDDWLDLGLDELPVTLAQRVRLLRVVLASAAVLRARLDQALAPAGITSQQAGLLQFIQAQPQAPTISFVAKALDMSHQNVKQIALALERKGFLEIAVDAHDRRSRRLHLTEHHHRFWRQRNPMDFIEVEAWTAGLSDKEVATTVKLLKQLTAAARQ